MKITSLEFTDLNSIASLQPEGWQNILPGFEWYLQSPLCFPIKVLAGDTVVGLGSTIIHEEVAWLGHIIVHKDRRKKGIGSMITQALIDDARSNNCKTIYLLATDLGAPVYEKAGFETETEYLFYKDVRLEKCNESFLQVRSYSPELNEQVLAMDIRTSGENRWVQIKDHLDTGAYYCENEILKGFYLPGFGEGLIIADDPAAGLGLLQLHLRSNEKIVMPGENNTVVNFLERNGFKESSTCKRMRLGEKRPVGFKNIYNRIGGNLG